MTTTKFKCCDDQRITCSEAFSYECTVTDEGKIHIDTNDFATDGYEFFECMNCNEKFEVEQEEMEW